MNAVVIEHVPVSDLPADWQVRLHAAPASHVTVRIEQEPGDTALTSNPLFGLWRDREELQDVPGYVRRLRASRYLPDTPEGQG